MAALDNTQGNSSPKGERIAKVIARSGLCSRRDAEALIEERRVSVNGAVLQSAALDILPEDKVLVDGRPLPERDVPRLWRYYKPKGRVTTHKDPEGRPTVFEALPEELPRLISVGRLDFNTEGLLLLTNDGDLARHLELPSTGWARRYRVRAHGHVEQAALDELADGLTIGRVHYGPIEASIEREQGDNVWITLSIREGKNREVRRIMEHLGLTVNRLIRISFGPFMLGELETGQVEEIKTRILKDQLGPRLSKELGVKREVLREDKKLAPAHGKSTYLRRKHEPVRPSRIEEERPLRRRRILGEDGEEAKVEYVKEKSPSRDGFRKFGGEAGGRERTSRDGAERPRRFDDRPPREGGDRPSFRERGDRGEGRPDYASARGEGRGDGERRPRNFDDRSERKSFGEHTSDQTAYDPLNADASARERPAYDPLTADTSSRDERPRREGGDRPPFRERSGRGEGRPSDRPRREDGERRPNFSGPKREGRGDGQREGRSFGGEGARGSFRDRPERKAFGAPRSDRAAYDPSKKPSREDRPRREGGDRPPFRERGEGGGGRPSFRPRRDDGEGRPSFRPRREDGERRSFDRKPDGDGARGGFGDRPERKAFGASNSERALYDPSKKPSRTGGPRRDGGDRPPFRERGESGESRSSFRPRREDGERRSFDRKPDGDGARGGFGDRPERKSFGASHSERALYDPSKKPSRTGGPRREGGDRPPFRERSGGGEGRPSFRPRREDGGSQREGRSFDRKPDREGAGGGFRDRPERKSFGAPRSDRAAYDPAKKPSREDRPRREGGDRPPFRKREEGAEGRASFRPRREDGQGRPSFREKKKDGEGGSSSGRLERAPGQGRRDGPNSNRKPGGGERGSRPQTGFRSDRGDGGRGASGYSSERGGGRTGRPPFKPRDASKSGPKRGPRGAPGRPRSDTDKE